MPTMWAWVTHPYAPAVAWVVALAALLRVLWRRRQAIERARVERAKRQERISEARLVCARCETTIKSGNPTLPARAGVCRCCTGRGVDAATIAG